MILGIMQPYFFPYLGYIDLINYSDRWIVFDTVQYIRHGWVNRNRILHPDSGWQYIVAPLEKHSRGTTIGNIRLADRPEWKNRITGQLTHYKKHAPYYGNVIDLVKECLSGDERSLAELNVNCLRVVCDYLGIEFQYEYLSELDLPVGEVDAPGQWALKISRLLDADEYVNPPGGEALFDVDAFNNVGIDLTIRNTPPITYQCGKYSFIENLSILDVMMWVSPGDIKGYLDRGNS